MFFADGKKAGYDILKQVRNASVNYRKRENYNHVKMDGRINKGKPILIYMKHIFIPLRAASAAGGGGTGDGGCLKRRAIPVSL